MSPRDDSLRLADMLAAAREARHFTAGRVESDLARDRQLTLALLKCVEIIGEAVNKIQRNAPALLQEAPEIPWEQMRGMRNVVIHEYFYVDLQVVWTTVRNDFPLLLDQIRALQQRRWKQQA